MRPEDYNWQRLEGLGFDLDFIENSIKPSEDNPCWKGYEAAGMKKKRGKMVPNCVPISKKYSENPLDSSTVSPSFEKHPTKPPKEFSLSEEGIHPNGKMITSQLRSMMENITVSLSLIKPESNLDPWVAAKVAEAEHSMTAIADYLKYKV